MGDQASEAARLYLEHASSPQLASDLERRSKIKRHLLTGATNSAAPVGGSCS